LLFVMRVIHSNVVSAKAGTHNHGC
jgi:hypothetical protein